MKSRGTRVLALTRYLTAFTSLVVTSCYHSTIKYKRFVNEIASSQSVETVFCDPTARLNNKVFSLNYRHRFYSIYVFIDLYIYNLYTFSTIKRFNFYICNQLTCPTQILAELMDIQIYAYTSKQNTVNFSAHFCWWSNDNQLCYVML